MKLRDFGENAVREWFLQVLDWSRRKITFEDNLDCIFLNTEIGTAQTEIPHSLGRAPKYVMEVAQFPNGTAGITLTKAPETNKLYIKRAVAGKCTLLLM